jgi:hypothetical protein
MSEGSDSLVHERPAWMIPAAIAAGVFIFSAAFAYYYFGPTPSEILGLDPRASESQDRVDMEIGDRHFLIPANFTRYPLQRVGGTQNEIDLHALLPELAPYSIGRKDEFEDNSSASRLVHIKIHLAGDLLPATRRLDDIYARHLASQSPQPGPASLDQYEFAPTSGYRDQELFVAEQTDNQPALILCFKETDVIFSPNCTRTLHLTNSVAVTYRYKRGYLESWETIDRAIIARIESFIVDDSPDDLDEPQTAAPHAP